MDPNTKITPGSIPPNSSPLYNPVDGLYFTTGGIKFFACVHEGWNAGGLIGTECNGVALLNCDAKNIVFAQHGCRGMGFQYRQTHAAEAMRIAKMSAQELGEFLNSHPKIVRYNPVTADAVAKAQAKGIKKLDKGIAKLAVTHFKEVPSTRAGDPPYMTAKEKQGTARDWELFILKRLAMQDQDLTETETGAIFQGWTKRLYFHFHLHLGYIAHYNQAGFFQVQFRNTADFLKNVQLMAKGLNGYGSPCIEEWGGGREYADLNTVMMYVAKTYLPLVEALYAKEQAAAEKRELEYCQRKLESQGMKVVPA